MDTILNILNWIDNSAFANAVRDSFWVFPSIETVHVVAMVIVLGSITRLDMRLMGLIWHDRPVSEVSEEMLPWTWTSFVIAAVFGFMLWASKPITYLGIAFFDMKMLLIILAGLNMLVFQFGIYRSVGAWDCDPVPPTGVRLAGAVSMACWLCVVVCGRLIGFV
ncbi:MAG TPA: DUF6644 family protein [Micropepsaceae bacterium]|nr:DUF6644 family protein [Micropepsaceae bacterium]